MVPAIPPRRPRVKRITGAVLIIFGLLFLVSGAVIGYLNVAATDSEGYSLSNTYNIRTQTCAYFLASYSDMSPQDDAFTKWVVNSADPGKDLFVGWAWYDDAANYSHSFKFEGPKRWDWDYGAYSSVIRFTVNQIFGNITQAPSPANQTFWLDHAMIRAGSGASATIHYNFKWQPDSEMKSLLIMNLDGSAGVSANLQWGTKIPILGWLPGPVLLIGVVLLAAGAILFRRPRPK